MLLKHVYHILSFFFFLWHEFQKKYQAIKNAIDIFFIMSIIFSVFEI